MTISKNEPLASIPGRLPAAEQYFVAYSGGVDSHVLLHLLSTHQSVLAGRLAAVHVNHRIHSQARAWARHCRDTCLAMGVDCDYLEVDGNPGPGESPEAAARHARYTALADWLPQGALLLSAQHHDDQAETLLLQLFRGAGPRGLAAMPAQMPLGRGILLRPMLDISRRAIMQYAGEHRLQWVEDPSNRDTHYDRNYLRHRVMPLLRQQWPGIDGVLARAAQLQADQAELAGVLAELDRRQLPQTEPGQFDCAGLGALSPPRQRNLLRRWLEENDLPLPSFATLEQVRHTVLEARHDSNPCVSWPGAQVRRFRDRLYAMKPLPEPTPEVRFAWDIRQPLFLPRPGGELSAVPETGCGLYLGEETRLEVGFRQGGEVLQPAGRREHHSLKKLFQEWQVPDWERARVPLLYRDKKIVAVAGHCVCEGFQARSDQRGYKVVWKPEIPK